MSEAVEIAYSDFVAIQSDMVRGPMGDGRDKSGRLFSIHRYTSRSTGKRYDVVHSADSAEPRCYEYPAYDPSE